MQSPPRLVVWNKKRKEGIIMQQIKCPECDQQLFGNEEYCPNCGRSIPENFRPQKGKKEEYRAAGRLLQKVSVAFLILGVAGAICAAVLYYTSLDEWNKNILLSIVLGLVVFASCVFPASVCYGLGKLVGSRAD